MVTTRPRANSRRKLGGSIWNQNIDEIRLSVNRISSAINAMLRILESNRNMPFITAISLHLTAASLSLTNILKALDEIEKIVQDNIAEAG